jgi:hypothetical protein
MARAPIRAGGQHCRAPIRAGGQHRRAPTLEPAAEDPEWE